MSFLCQLMPQVRTVVSSRAHWRQSSKADALSKNRMIDGEAVIDAVCPSAAG